LISIERTNTSEGFLRSAVESDADGDGGLGTTLRAPWSLAWSILALAAHRRRIASLHDSLSALSDLSNTEDTGTLAMACLALDYNRALSAFGVTV
jgi:hypothetical protein